MKRLIFSPGIHSHWTSLGLLVLRAGIGGAMIGGHGWKKLTEFSETVEKFPDPLGLGNATLSLSLTIFAEVFCSAFLVVGLATRVVVLPILFAMVVAIFMVHGDQGWARQEMAFLYTVPLSVLFLTGAGTYSVDALICRPTDPSMLEA